MKQYCILKLILLFATAITFAASAQTFQAKADLRAERLLPEDQDILREIPRNLEEYINNYRWGDEDEEIIIRCDFNIIIESVTERSGQKVYRGQLLVGSQSGENFLDKSFELPYQRGQLMEHTRGSYDALLTVIDYYVNMILGGEMDTFILRGGTRYYDQARNFVSEGRVSQFAGGWSNRQEMVEVIRNGDHEALRDAKFYYYEGLFYIEERKDAQKAPGYAKRVVELLDKVYRRSPNSQAMKRFMDAHYQEFCWLFTYDSDRSNLQAMMRIDNRHRESYEECVLTAGGGRIER